MTPATRRNLDRLLRPRQIAVFGGRDAEVVIGECRRIGYRGEIWPVNPKRTSIAGYHCFARIEDLPRAPDAAYIAVPRDAAIDTLRLLSAMGAGGAVCYTAGFGEIGPEGQAAESALVKAAGDVALGEIGPYGLRRIRYRRRLAR